MKLTLNPVTFTVLEIDEELAGALGAPAASLSGRSMITLIAPDARPAWDLSIDSKQPAFETVLRHRNGVDMIPASVTRERDVLTFTLSQQPIAETWQPTPAPEPLPPIKTRGRRVEPEPQVEKPDADQADNTPSADVSAN